MSQPDDDFPPTQAAPPPPPEPPPRDPRSLTHTANVYEGVEQLLPARTWKENPLVWIALVVAMFMAVPLLANLTGRDKPAPPKPRTESATTAPPQDSAPAPAVAVPTAAPAPVNAAPSPPAPSVEQLPPNLRPQTDASRHVITKCYENGRVVYTQTGKCTGSVSAVPIDTGKNVVGPGGAAPTAPGGNTR